MKIIMSIILWGVALFGISPSKTLPLKAPCVDIVIRHNIVWGSLANGEVLKISPYGKILEKMQLPKKIDAWGEHLSQQAMSLDVSTDGSMVAIAGEEGSVFISKNKKIQKTSFMTRSVIKKIAFASPTQLLIAMISNEITLYDIVAQKVVWTITGGTSPLSDMAISGKKDVALIAGEAGIVKFFNPLTGATIGSFKGGNVDNIYKLDYQNGITLTSGQDRRAIVYSPQGKVIARVNGSFLIYAGGLSPLAKTAAIATDEQNTITIFDIEKQRVQTIAKGHNATLNRIAFIDEKKFVSCADENKILFWELP